MTNNRMGEIDHNNEFSRWEIYSRLWKGRLKSLAESWQIYARSPIAVIGLLLLVLFAFMAVSHPLLMKYAWQKSIYDPLVGYDIKIFPHPSLPSSSHLFGTDALGRDVLSILLASASSTFLMAICASLTTAICGTIAASLSAYFGGWVDTFFTTLANTALLLPAPILMVIIGFTLKPSPLIFGFIYGVINGLGGVAIVLRAQALTVIPKTFMDAAKIAGGKNPYIIVTHLIPHMLPLVAVNMMITVTGAIFADGFIAFMGLSRSGLNWGTMIYDSFTYQAISSTIPWNVMIPAALSISLFAASFYMISQGLYLVAEPRAREVPNGQIK